MTPAQREKFVSFLAEDGHERPEAWFHLTHQLLMGVDVRGKRVLEVGSGKGLLSLHLALHGARQVTSMEPELEGSRSGMIALQEWRRDELGLRNLTLLNADFNSWSPTVDDHYDMVVCANAINHLYPSDRNALRHEATWRGYLNTIAKFRGIVTEDGSVLVSEQCRYGLFLQARDWGLRRPWARRRSNVNWRYHQQPSAWRRLFEDAGFRRVHVAYPVPYKLRGVSKLTTNFVVNFLLSARFALRAER